jgi:hypothetical protein
VATDEDEDVDSGWGTEDEPAGTAAPVVAQVTPAVSAPPAPATPSLAKPSAEKPTLAKPSAEKPTLTKPPADKPSVEAKAAEAKVGDTKAADTKAADTKAADTKAADAARTAPTRDALPRVQSPKTGPRQASAASTPDDSASTFENRASPNVSAEASGGAKATGKTKPPPRIGPATAEALRNDALEAEQARAQAAQPHSLETDDTSPAKPASKAPPPKLAVGPRPLGVPPAPRTPSVGAFGKVEVSKVAEPDFLDAALQAQPLEKLDADSAPPLSPLPSATRPGPSRAASVSTPPKPEGTSEAAPPRSIQPQSGVPKSRSFTPRVTNAAEQARELDVRVAADPNTPTPPGTSVVAAALAASALRESSRPNERPTPLRMPSVTSREASEAPRPAVFDARPASTSLRFQEPSKPRPIPRDRKQTVRLMAATQPAIDLIGREDEAASSGVTKSRVSSPMLDLHLPDDLTSLDEGSTPRSAHADHAHGRAAKDESPEIEIADHGEFSDSFSDLPIDEVLEAVRQSSMPPPDDTSSHTNASGGRRDSSELDSLAPRSMGASLSSDPPRISDLPLDGPMFPSSDEQAPVSDLPPTVRGAPPDELRFGAASEPASIEPIEDARVTPIRERFDRGDFAGALLRAEALLEEQPGHAGAKAFVQKCQERVKEMYIARLGSCDSVLHVVMSRDKIQDLAFDHRGGFLISLIDGVATVDDVLDISGMPQLEALRLLFELQQEGVIDASPAVARG